MSSVYSDSYFREFYTDVYSNDFSTSDVPHGWIQWKGTEVCIDLHCTCGHHGHFDGDFFYFYQCPSCDKKYAVGQNVKLIELSEDAAKYAESGWGFKTDTDSDTLADAKLTKIPDWSIPKGVL